MDKQASVLANSLIFKDRRHSHHDMGNQFLAFSFICFVLERKFVELREPVTPSLQSGKGLGMTKTRNIKTCNTGDLTECNLKDYIIKIIKLKSSQNY